MNKYHLLILLCCISNVNIFGSEKENIERRDLEYTKHCSYQRKTKEEAYRENYNKTIQLEEQQKYMIELYEQKITSMQLQIEDKDRKINQLQSNK